MGISDRKRSIDVPVSINLDLNQEPKPNQLIVGNTLKGGDFVSRKKSGNILAGSKLNVEGQGILTVKNVTPDLFKKLSKQTPISGGNPPSQTPTPTPTITPTSTPTNVGCSGIPYNLSDILDIPLSGNILFGFATNNPDAIIPESTLYFNTIDYYGVDRTSYFSNLVGNYFTLTLCQNNVTAIFSGNPNSMYYSPFGPPYGDAYYWDGDPNNLIQIVSANTLFNYNELVYVDYTAVVLTPTPTPTITPTPSITPTYTPTPTPTNPTTPFISVWRTTSPSESITLPYISGNFYTGFIDWGDGSLSANTYSNRTHTYVFSGDYTVRIYGSIDTMRFNNSGDKLKIREILQWGPNFHLKTLGTFYGCSNLVLTGVTDTPLISLDGAVSIFEDCVSITTINNLNSWNISSITNMASMFKGCTNFNQPLSGWDVSNVIIMSQMFNGCSSFNQPLSGWNVSNVSSMGNMFSFATQFDQPIGNWTVSGVSTMFGMFSYATSFNQPLSGWDVSNVYVMSYMFSDSSFNQPIGNWDVSNVNNMVGMFQYSLFNQPLSGWNVSNLISASYMFYNSQFDQPIGNWNVSGVTNMSNMFSYTTSFNQPLSGWNVSKVINMDTMFFYSQFDQPIGNWNVSGVTNMSNMFGFSQFNQPLSGWNVSKVINMGGMFASSQFDQPIGNWNVSGVTYMNSMFQYSLFNQPLSGWDVSNVINMAFMFRQSTFNQDIGNWNISGVTNFTDFMDGKIPATFSTTNLDSIYSGWSTKNPYTGLTINFGSANYTTSGGAAGKAILTGSTGSGGYAWTITDGGGI